MVRIAAVLALILTFVPAVVGGPDEAEKTGKTEKTEKDPILAAVDEIIPEVEAIRGLKFKHPVKREIMTAEDIGRIVREKLAEEVPPEKLAGMNLLLARMGFMRPGTKLEEVLEQFLKAGAAGLYVPEKKTLYILKGYSVNGAKPIIFHELVHALEDQYYDLDAAMRKHMNDSDRAAGVQGLVEGTAQHMTGKYLRKYPALMYAMQADAQKKAGEQMKLLTDSPLALFAGMAFYPYFNGPAFVYRATKDDASKIADLYALPPASSEQVLHPEKYGVNGDYPHTVRLPGLEAAIPDGWEHAYEDSVGELQIGFLLNEFEGGNPAAKLMRILAPTQKIRFRGQTKVASEGWDGDWVRAFRGPDGECGFVWMSVWDSEADATEFHEAYRKAIPFKWNVLGVAPATVRFGVKKNRVLIVEGFPEDDLRTIAEAAWEKATVVADPRDKLDGGAGTPTPEK